MAISGTAVAIATIGGVLMYAGFQDENPWAAVSEVFSGNAKSVSATSSDETAQQEAYITTPNASGSPTITQAADLSGPFPALVAAVEQNKNDIYTLNPAKRFSQGYSDCSSFLGKGFIALGITPPGASTTLNYLTWESMTTIPVANAGAGDILVNAAHVVIVTSPGNAIGQENPRRNVVTGTYADLMSGTGSYIARRYTGGKASVTSV